MIRMGETLLNRKGIQQVCKICGRTSEYFATLMPFKAGSAPGHLGTGWTVNYHRCFFCGFIFTTDMDAWSVDEFSANIYNEGYHQVDPDFEFARPRSQADHFIYKLRQWGEPLSILDYGGGRGVFAQLMCKEGFDVTACDPIYVGSLPEPRHQYDLITCNEVWEHVPDPHGLLAQLEGYLKKDGVIWVGTHQVPNDIEKLGTSWWYFAPRNGHISFYTRWSFEMLFAQYGFQYASTVEFTHLGFRWRTPLAALLDHP
jgi:SAM-dependent methyltransferase